MKEETRLEMDDELRPEYDLPQLLKDGVRGKYAERYKAGTNLVLLAPDVTQAYPNKQARPPMNSAGYGTAPDKSG
jgi:hypothetical protein